MFIKWYTEDPDAGIHGAVDWLLRQPQWGQADKLKAIDEQLAGHKPPKSRDWFVNNKGQTFTIIRGPAKLSLPGPGKHIGIDKSFTIATREVSVAQYTEFLEKNPGVVDETKQPIFKQFIPTPNCAMGGVNWYDAIRYCNWLSQEEGLTKCYPDKIVEGMSMQRNWMEQTGYRLPTGAEWEYACSAWSVSARFYGGSAELLPRYDWFSGNPENQMHPPGLKKPNDFGLFDMLGNAYEWTHDPLDGELDRVFSDTKFRAIRGGSFIRPAPSHTSGALDGYRAYERSVLGFRIVRTLSLDDPE